MIIIIDTTDVTVRPGQVEFTRYISPNHILNAVFVAFFNHEEFYIVKSKWAKEHVYGNIEDLAELVDYHIARIVNK